MILSLVPMKGPSVPDQLRELADAMEDGTYETPDAMVYVFEGENGQFAGSLGNIDAVRAAGLCFYGAAHMWQESSED